MSFNISVAVGRSYGSWQLLATEFIVQGVSQPIQDSVFRELTDKLCNVPTASKFDVNLHGDGVKYTYNIVARRDTGLMTPTADGPFVTFSGELTTEARRRYTYREEQYDIHDPVKLVAVTRQDGSKMHHVTDKNGVEVRVPAPGPLCTLDVYMQEGKPFRIGGK